MIWLLLIYVFGIGYRIGYWRVVFHGVKVTRDAELVNGLIAWLLLWPIVELWLLSSRRVKK